MNTTVKEKEIIEIPFALKCLSFKNDFSNIINQAKENGIPFTVINEILMNIVNQVNSFAMKEQSNAMAYYQKQKQELEKNKNCESTISN